jgi:hypothetical protein
MRHRRTGLTPGSPPSRPLAVQRQAYGPRLMIVLDLISQSYADFETVMALARKFFTVLSTTWSGLDDGCSSKRIRD